MVNMNKVFVGIPLSQFKSSDIVIGSAKPMIDEILNYISDNQLTLMDLNQNDFNFELDSTYHFFNWLIENKTALLKIDFDFVHSYSKNNESPIIFGQYINSNINENKLVRYNSNLSLKIEEISLMFFSILDNMHPKALQLLDENQLIGAFINNHSE